MAAVPGWPRDRWWGHELPTWKALSPPAVAPWLKTPASGPRVSRVRRTGGCPPCRPGCKKSLLQWPPGMGPLPRWCWRSGSSSCPWPEWWRQWLQRSCKKVAPEMYQEVQGHDWMLIISSLAPISNDAFVAHLHSIEEFSKCENFWTARKISNGYWRAIKKGLLQYRLNA